MDAESERLALAREIAEALTLDDLRSGALGLFARCVGASHLAWYEGTADGSMLLASPHGSGTDEAIREYYSYFHHDDLLHPAKTACEDTIAIPTQLVEWRAYKSSRVYTEFYRKCDIEHVLRLRLLDKNSGVIIARSRNGGEFDSTAIRLIRDIEAALVAAAKRIVRHAHVCMERDALLAGSDSSDAFARLTLIHGLTTAEVRVLRALSSGGTNADIGKRLFLSPATVRTHLMAIFRKLGVHTRVEAILLAQANIRRSS